MKVFTIKASGGYCGGMAIIAANSKDDVMKVFASDHKYDYSFEMYDINGEYTSDVSKAVKVAHYYFDPENIKESTTLQTNVTEPQVLYCEWYAE